MYISIIYSPSFFALFPGMVEAEIVPAVVCGVPLVGVGGSTATVVVELTVVPKLANENMELNFHFVITESKQKLPG